MPINVKKAAAIGVKETLEVFDFADAVIDAVRISKANDGKVDWRDAGNFFTPGFKLMTAITGIEKVDDELVDLDAQEIAILESRITKYANNPRYAVATGHLLAFANEIAAIVKEDKADKALA